MFSKLKFSLFITFSLFLLSACKRDNADNGLSIKVRLDLAIAVCSHCGTRYSLSTYGTPVSGPGKHPLKNYKTSFEDDRFIRVWNQ